MKVFVCANRHAVFPERLLCPVCANGEWHSEDSPIAEVEAVTELASGVRLADVRLDSGPVVIAPVDAADQD